MGPLDTFCTFVIPTVGRATLATALASLASQTDDDLSAVVVGDGVDVNLNDLGFWARGIRGERSGSAGLTRNQGLAWIVARSLIGSGRPEWVAFLDDDDTVGPQYVRWLRSAAEAAPEMDVAIFRMHDARWGVLPSVLDPKIAQGHVGISFAVRWRWIAGGARFISERDPNTPGKAVNEDIAFLQELAKNGAKLAVLPQIAYFVGPREAKAA